jgi:uncharacterized coiled-coil protein SlyX
MHCDSLWFGVVPSDPIPSEAGELSIDQLFGFYANKATKEFNFGQITTLKDAATECAQQTAHAVNAVETSEADLNRRMVVLEFQLAQQAKHVDECKREAKNQQQTLEKCMKQLAIHADKIIALEWSSCNNS